MFKLRAVAEILSLFSANTRWICSHSNLLTDNGLAVTSIASSPARFEKTAMISSASTG
jgi:hypothetical protein